MIKAGKAKITFDWVVIDKATEYAAEDADITLRLWQVLKPRLAAEHVLHRLRDAGAAAVARARPTWSGAAFRSTARCCRGSPANSPRKRPASRPRSTTLAGEPVNVGSPKQIGDILFGKLQLPGGTKTKTGQWSTGARQLEELAEQGHELPQKILDWRQVSN